MTVGLILEAIMEVGFNAGGLGETIRRAFEGLGAANRGLKSAGLDLRALSYEQALELVRVLVSLSGRGVALFLDAWEKSPDLILEVREMEAVLGHLDDWPNCHMYLGVRHPDLIQDESSERAAAYVVKLEKYSSAAQVFNLPPLHLDSQESIRLSSFLRTNVPGAATTEWDTLLRLVDGYPGVIDRWLSTAVRGGCARFEDLEHSALDAHALRYGELNVALSGLEVRLFRLVCRLALVQQLDEENWFLLRELLLRDCPEDALETLCLENLLESLTPSPSFGHETRHQAVINWLLVNPAFRALLSTEANALIFSLAESFADVTVRRVALTALSAMRQPSFSLSVSRGARALVEAVAYLTSDATSIDASALDVDPEDAGIRQVGGVRLFLAALLIRAWREEQDGNHQKALYDCERVLQLTHGLPIQRGWALYNRGRLHERRGVFGLATADYSQAIELSECDPELKVCTLTARAELRIRMADSTGAWDDLEVAWDTDDVPAGPRARTLLVRAALRLNCNDSDGAVGDYMALLEDARTPLDLRAWTLASRALLKIKSSDLSGALEDATAALAVTPDWRERSFALYVRAAVRLKIGDLDGANVDLVDVVHDSHTSPEVLVAALSVLAFVRKLLGDTAGSLAACAAVLESGGACSEARGLALRTRGDVSGEAGDLVRAVQDYSDAVECSGISSRAKAAVTYSRGLLRAKLSDARGALADYTAVVELIDASPAQRAQALRARGALKEERGNVVGALADYSAAIGIVGALTDTKAWALNRRGHLRERQGDSDGALADYTAVVELVDAPFGRRAWALHARGALKEGRKDTVGALADYSAAIDLVGAPTNPRARALNSRGYLRQRLGDSDGALADYTAVVELVDAPPGRRAWALHARGALKEGREDTVGALADYSAAIDLVGTPTNARARALNSRGYLRQRLGDSDGAVADYTAVVELVDAPPGRLAWALNARGALREEREDLVGALADYSAAFNVVAAPVATRALALENRAAANEAKGDPMGARADYSALIALPDLGEEVRSEAMKQLRRLEETGTA